MRSIIGRFLEHSRIFCFGNGGTPEYYLGSADWMPRNFDRRVETVAPIEDPALHARLESLLRTCLDDNRQAWMLQPDGTYVQRHAGRGRAGARLAHHPAQGRLGAPAVESVRASRDARQRPVTTTGAPR